MGVLCWGGISTSGYENAVLNDRHKYSALEVETKYKFSDLIAGFFKIGFQKSSFQKPTTTIGNKELTDKKALDSGSLNGSTINFNPNSNIDPFKNTAINMDGIILSFGVDYKF